jgi:hypothetical protein
LPTESHRRWEATVLGGTHQKNGMPGFGNPPGFPIVMRKMTAQESEAIHAYVIEQSWKAYNAEQSKLGGSKTNQ